MKDLRLLRSLAEEHRRSAQETDDLWEGIILLQLATRYEELAAHYERRAAQAAAQSQVRALVA